MTQRQSKYNARPTSINGIRFDSQAEARRYVELSMLQQAGAIKNLVVHPRYELQRAFTYGECKFQPVYYEADFQYRETDTDTLVVEDVKGVETDVFKLKMKWFLYQYQGIDFRLVKP